MNSDPRDDLDQVIDDALATAVAGEPRRVNAASVRAAMGKPGRSMRPLWFGLAAAAIVVFVTLSLRAPSAGPGESVIASRPDQEQRLAAAQPADFPSYAPAIQVRATPVPSVLLEGTKPREPRRMPVREPTAIEPAPMEPYEGLPRLVTAALILPESMDTREIQAAALSIPALETAPLSLPRLSSEYEPQ